MDDLILALTNEYEVEAEAARSAAESFVAKLEELKFLA